MYYKHSGRLGLGGLGVGLVVGGAASLILAYAYARGIILITEVHFAGLATIAFGGLIGSATGYGMVLGKARNRRVTFAVAGVISCLALYVSWAVWIQAILQSQHVRTASLAAFAIRPRALWHLIRLINHYGTWGLDKGSATTGWALWLIWSLEAGTVIGVAGWVSIAVLNYRPFCEACGNWCGRGTRILLALPTNLAQLKLQLESGDLQPLASLAPGSKNADHLIVDLNSCNHCCQFHTLSLKSLVFHRSKMGRVQMKWTTIMKQLLVGTSGAESIRQLSEKVSQAAKLAPPKVNAAAAGK